MKLPDAISDEPKHISQCGMALRCWGWRYNHFVFQMQCTQRSDFE